MKKYYIELMDKVLSAYAEEDIIEYFERVKRDGLKEHGFPRLTACIGILISKGRRAELLPLFCDMMELCCSEIPRVKAANDFSVREIVCALYEVERAGAVPREMLDRWRDGLSKIVPEECYTVYATDESSAVRNWALFTGVSEYFRLRYLGLPISEFVEIQIGSQMKWIDEMGMYQDYDVIHNPTMYDAVSRMLFSLLLRGGYRGRYYDTVSEFLHRGAVCSLKMQSALGELPFGGRSNQFLHNEATVAAVFEFEATRLREKEDGAFALEFDKARAAAIKNIEEYLNCKPISHVKNRFAISSGFGCEGYAYFDKYMVTAASNLYAAYCLCDGVGEVRSESLSEGAYSFKTTEHFHKVFLRAGEYSAEFDLNADLRYDASGLGRFCRLGAPSVIAMNLPCPREHKFKVDISEKAPLSICPGTRAGGEWHFATDTEHRLVSLFDSECGSSARNFTAADSFDEKSREGEKIFAAQSSFAKGDYAAAELSAVLSGEEIRTEYLLSGEGLSLTVFGKEAALMLPAFHFNGAEYSEILNTGSTLCVKFGGWECVYEVDGEIFDLGQFSANRNGHYKGFAAYGGGDILRVKIKIEKQK